MKLVKVQLNEAIAGVNESYSDGEIVSFPTELAARLVNQGTANYFKDTDEVLELKETIDNKDAEIARLKKELAKKKK